MRKRTARALLVFALLFVAAMIIAVIHVRRAGPPEAARLLPEGDAVVYANLRMLRFTTAFGETASLSDAPEYREFVAATGVQPSDLTEAATAVHLPPPPPPPPPAPRGRRPPVAKLVPEAYARYSHIFIGKFDSKRLEDYLRKLTSSTQNVESVEVFNIPLEDRTLRVAILGVDTVAVSNALTDGPMREMISHYSAAAQPFAGPAVVRQYYDQVPFASLAWAVGRIPAERATAAALPAPLPELPAGTVVVASARYALGAVQVRAEAITGDPGVATRLTRDIGAFLAVFRAMLPSPAAEGEAAPTGDADVRALIESIRVEQKEDRAILTATVTQGFIRKALEEPPAPAQTTDAAPRLQPPDAKR
jgi:hypothetical protein